MRKSRAAEPAKRKKVRMPRFHLCRTAMRVSLGFQQVTDYHSQKLAATLRFDSGYETIFAVRYQDIGIVIEVHREH